MAPKLDVEAGVYYAAANTCFDVASGLYVTFGTTVQILGGCGEMAGSYESGLKWATSYDERVRDVLAAVNDLTEALENYGGILNQSGYNHADADKGKGGSPTLPADSDYTETGTLDSPPSAGGPGNGLVSDILELVPVDIPIPDGDTDKLEIAAGQWEILATGQYVPSLPAQLEGAAWLFQDIVAPEVAHIDDDLREMRGAAEDIVNACAELAQSCRDYKQGLEELREKLSGILDDLKQEAIETAVITIAASLISFGAGAVVGSVKAAKAVKTAAKAIRETVEAWHLAKRISQGVKATKDLKRLRSVLERIKALGRKLKPTSVPTRPQGVPNEFVYRPANNGKGAVWQKPGSTGNADSVRVMDPKPGYPDGYVRFYNQHGQPIDLAGKPGSQAATHIPRSPDGTYQIPKGW